MAMGVITIIHSLSRQKDTARDEVEYEKLEDSLNKNSSSSLLGTATAKVQVNGETFIAKIRAISEEKPPTMVPIRFALAVLGLCCCCLTASVLSLFACCIGILFLGCLPVAEIVIGVLYYDPKYCPQENIALLLIVGGCLAIAAGIDCCGLFDFACICWLVGSAVIVYRFYDKVSYVEGDPNFCEPILYRFLFWIVTLSLGAILTVVSVVISVIGCAFCVAFAMAGTDQGGDLHECRVGP